MGIIKMVYGFIVIPMMAVSLGIETKWILLYIAIACIGIEKLD